MRGWTLALAVAAALSAPAQDDTRQVFDSHWRTPDPRPAGSPVVAPQYRRVAGPEASKARRPLTSKRQDLEVSDSAAAFLGVTVWKLEPSARGDNTRLLVLDAGGKADYTPHRVEVGGSLRLGDKVPFRDAEEARKALATL